MGKRRHLMFSTVFATVFGLPVIAGEIVDPGRSSAPFSSFGAPATGYNLLQMTQLLEDTTWGWTDEAPVCQKRVREFRFNSDISEMSNSQLGGKIDVYQVLSNTNNSITMQIYGENRLTKTGEPVIWELRFDGPDKFCWHRLDWLEQSCTASLIRCGENDLIS